jgi:hypothetical protein
LAKFDEIQAEMDSILAKLQTTTGDGERRALLQRLRLLLLRADNLVAEPRKIAKSAESP